MRVWKNQDYILETNNSNVKIGKEPSKFYTEDKNSASIRLFVNWHDRPVDFSSTDLKPVLDLFHSDGSIWLGEELDIVIAEKGIVQYKIPENVISHAGTIKAKLFLRDDKQSVHVANFKINITSSGVEEAISKEVNVNLVEDIVKQIIDEEPQLFKGEKGDKLTFNDLTPEDKEELKGEPGKQGEQGDKGDTTTVPPKIYTREEYDQLEVKDSHTLYFISEV